MREVLLGMGNNSEKKRGRPFPKGRSGNPRGRPKGSKDKVPRDFRVFCQQLCGDPDYQEGIRARLLAGELHPTLEKSLWEHAVKWADVDELLKAIDDAKIEAEVRRRMGLPPETATARGGAIEH